MKNLFSLRGASRFALPCAVALLVGHSARATDGTWSLNGSGNWDVSGNWVGGNVADGAGSIANFANLNITAIRTVTIDGNVLSPTVGTLNIGDTTSTFFGYTVAATNGGTLTFNNSGAGATLAQAGSTGTNIFSVPLVLADSLRVSNASSSLLTISGGITSSGTQNLTLAANGSGGITLSGGSINHTGLLTNSGIGSGTTTISSVIGSNVTGVTQNGLSPMILNGSAVNTYTGATTVNRGTLTVDFANLATPTNLIDSSSVLNLGGGTLAIKGKATGVTSQTLGNLTLAGNSFSGVTLTPNGGTSTTLTLGNWTRNAGSTLLVDLSAAGTSTLTSSPTLTNGILGYALVKDATSTGFATVSGGNVVRYTGASTLATGTDDATGNYKTTAALTHNAGDWSLNSLEIATTATATVNLGSGKLTLTSGGILTSPTAALTISNGQIGADNSEVIFHQVGSSTATVSGTISSGTGSLTKDGSGSLILTGANSYTGDTVISGGTLQVGSGATGSISSSSNVINNAALIINRNSATSFTNVISGTGTVQKSGSTVTLGSSNTYTGKTTINGGTLVVSSLNSVVGGTSSSSLGAPTTTANGTIAIGLGTSTTAAGLQYTGSGETTDRIIAGVGNAGMAVTLDSSGTGPLVFTSDGSFGSFTGSGSHTFFLTGTNTGLNTFKGIFNQAGTGTGGSYTIFTKRGVGTWLLTGTTSNYGGATTVSEGTLIAGGNVAVSTNGVFGNAASAIVLGDSVTATNNGSPTLLTGGAFTIGRDVTVANQATSGTYTIGGNADAVSTFSGLVTANKNLTISQVATTGNNALQITGGITGSTVAATPTTITFAGSGAKNVSSGAISNGTGGSALSVATSGGTTTLSGSHSYTGTTSINGGTLKVNGTLSGTSGVTVASTGTLSGNGGTINSSALVTVQGGGTFQPGAGLANGTLSTGAVSMLSNATLALTLNTATLQSSVLTVTGNFDLALTNDVVLTLNDLGGDAELLPGQGFTLATYTGLWNGGLFKINGVARADGSQFLLGTRVYTIDYNQGGNTVAITSVPEPRSTGVVLVIALGLVLFVRARSQRMQG